MRCNPATQQATTSVYRSPESSVIQVGATNPSLVSEFLTSQFGGGAPIAVHLEAPDRLMASRYASSGPVIAGSGIAAEGESCTAGYGARAEKGKFRGESQYAYFVLTAGHCFPSGASVGRQLKPHAEAGPKFGAVRRGPYSPAEYAVTDAEGILIDESIRSHSVLNGSPLEAQSIQGVEPVKVESDVCWSGVEGGNHCGKVLYQYPSIQSQHGRLLYRVAGPVIAGDSGGPVWDPVTHKAVGLITSGAPGVGRDCRILPSGHEWCPRMGFTALLTPSGSSFAPGILPWLGLEVLKEG